MSYRFAWGLLSDASDAFGAPLVDMQRGRSARLSALGRRVVQADASVRHTLAEPFERLRSELRCCWRRSFPGGPAPDPACEPRSRDCRACPACARRRSSSTSCSAARMTASPRWRAANAIWPASTSPTPCPAPPLRPRRSVSGSIRASTSCCISCAREQGLIARPGSRIRGVHDLARPGVRFIHRQNPAEATRDGRDGSVAADVVAAAAPTPASACARKPPAQACLRAARDGALLPRRRESARCGTPASRRSCKRLSRPAACCDAWPGCRDMIRRPARGEHDPLATALSWVER